MGWEGEESVENDMEGDSRVPCDTPDRVLDARLEEAASSYREKCTTLPAAPEASGEVVWMVGLPGAGKTTIAAGLPGRIRLGIDDVREELNLEFSDPGWTSRAYDVALDRLRGLLDAGQPVVFDSTGLYETVRHQVLRIGGCVGVPVRTLWVDTPIPICRGRQEAKGRNPDSLFFNHCIPLLLQAVSTELLAEPFDSYHRRSGVTASNASQEEACW